MDLKSEKALFCSRCRATMQNPFRRLRAPRPALSGTRRGADFFHDTYLIFCAVARKEVHLNGDRIHNALPSGQPVFICRHTRGTRHQMMRFFSREGEGMSIFSYLLTFYKKTNTENRAAYLHTPTLTFCLSHHSAQHPPQK